MVSFMPWLLYPWGKSPQYPLDRRLGGPQGQSGCGGKENKKNISYWNVSSIRLVHFLFTLVVFTGVSHNWKDILKFATS